MAIAPLGGQVPRRHDIILYAVPGALEGEDLKMLDQWREKGAMVIPFSSSAGVFGNHFPIDTVANVIDLWTWTGEFVAACTRLGQMPVLYQSYGLPGGRERAKKYQGKRFHDDSAVQPAYSDGCRTVIPISVGQHSDFGRTPFRFLSDSVPG